MNDRHLPILAPAALALAVLPLSALAQEENHGEHHARNSYVVTNLLSDQQGAAHHVDTHLVNAWGIAHGAQGPWWVANNGTSTSTLYDGDGNPQTLVVQVPGNPTGTVVNATSNFVVSNGTNQGPAVFLFASEDGTISGWNPAVPPPPQSHQAFVVVDNSTADAIYKGLAIASTPHGDFLYAADFHNGRVDVFDGQFHPVHGGPGSFVDPHLPAHYAPFGIQQLHDRIFVAYAKQDANAEDEIAGPGLGIVSVFETSGHFVARVASHGPLNAPWGMAIAPEGFGPFGGCLLVGNFGNGRINAYDLHGFEHRGHLKGTDEHAIEIDGLWGVGFGNDAAAGPRTTLFFAAGPDDEHHGLFGSITANASGPGHGH